ncbi:DEKNAAC104988 [Brettanomyces naardenensis]|uniref:DEKNAAC104988 n=1 Tax=Brettanomyces naardenensis TaxID=13370 RepID=A0A448YSG0_BRENA|nr:DEKNAAC104988 [Brettanomyces naardenensis]
MKEDYDKNGTFLSRLTTITNDLNNYKPLGVLYCYNIPDLPSKQLESPDGFDWCDFPYDYDVRFRDNSTISPVICDIRYLIRRAYIRVTYKVFRFGIAVGRLYILPEGIAKQNLINCYRDDYARLRKSQTWHNKIRERILKHLLTILDYSTEAWDMQEESHFLQYIKARELPLVNCLTSFRLFETSVLGQNWIEQRESEELFGHHIDRLIGGRSFQRFGGKQHARGDQDAILQERVSRVYATIKSPQLDLSTMNDDQKEVISGILDGEVPGFKSELYNYQRRSVAKMYEKEMYCRRVPMPTIATLKEGCYLDLSSLTFLLDPPTYSTPRGGILAENMGLGKTCICLALICLSKFQIARTPIDYQKDGFTTPNVRSLLDNCVEFITRNSIQWKHYSADLPTTCAQRLEGSLGYFDKEDIRLIQHNMRHTRSTVGIGDVEFQTVSKRKLYLSSTTLIVIPDNLFQQWVLEINKHVLKDYLKVLEIPSVGSPLPERVTEIVNNDVVLMSLHAFARQSRNENSILRSIYWKRLIVDEGHSMNARYSRAVEMATYLMAERKWTITGTPTSGLTNLHIEEDDNEYTVKKSFNARQDLVRMGIVISNFLQVEPWKFDRKLWTNTVIKPFEKRVFHSDYQLSELLKNLIVRHTIEDVQRDITLPKMHHRAVFLKPSYFDKLSINLFIAVLSANAVTSERTGVDFMFDPSNKGDLRRLINNLQKATFYWTGFTIQDIDNLLNICQYSLKENKEKYSEADVTLLRRCMYVSKVALSNSRWRTNSSVHEMSYFVTNLPPSIRRDFTISQYPSVTDDFENPVGVYGFPQLIAIQRFYYRHRTVSTSVELEEKMLNYTKEFWQHYGRNNDRLNGVRRRTQVVNKELDFTSIDFETIEEIDKFPTWVDKFNAEDEEQAFYESETKRLKRTIDGERSFDAKRRKVDSFDFDQMGPPYSSPPKSQSPGYETSEKVGSLMGRARILGTASAKLSYLTSRLLENEMNGSKSIVFYEFENSAYYLTEFLDILGMNYIMYSPHIKTSQRSKNLADFDQWDTGKEHEGHGIALIMDLKLASHGLTILAATHVFFINPVWNKTVEAQAIKRAHRIGQTHEVFVETLILENTIEEEMYYRRATTESKKEISDTETELIDNTGIQEYVMKFMFLRMYDESQALEIAPVMSDTSIYEPLNAREEEYEGQGEDGIGMGHVKSNVTSDMIRHWDLPLFSLDSMTKLSTSDFNKSRKHSGRVTALKTEADQDKKTTAYERVNRKTVGIMKKLKGRRKVHFG